MKKISFKSWIEKIRQVALRFPFVLFFLLGLAFMLFLQINKHGIDIKPNKWTFFALGIGLSLAVTLFSEEFKNILVKIGLNLLSVLLLLTYCYFLPDKFLPVHFYQVISVGIVLILSAFVVPFFKKNNDISFWEFSKSSVIQLIVTSVFANVLMAGLSLAILSLNFLFKIDVQHEVYQNLAVVCFALFAPVYFLSNITPENDMHVQEYTFIKFLKILGLYILVPILALYSLILYVYLAQIIVKWELPNGWVSTLVSVLGLGGFLAMLILYPLRLKEEKENKIVTLLSMYFPIVLLPLLILMSVGIFRRLGDYGLTINRLYVMILNVWLYGICIYLFLSKANHLKWIVISFAVVLLVSSVGPWSVYHITKRTMINEIAQLLSESRLLKDGKAIDNTQKIIALEPELAKSLSEDIKYMTTNYGIEKLQAFFNTPVKDKSWTDLNILLGISEVPITDTFFNAWTDKENALKIDLNPYKSLIFMPSFNNEKFKLLSNAETDITFSKMDIQVKQKSAPGNVFIIPLKSKIKEILKTQKIRSSHSIDEMTITNENCKFIITSVTGNYYSHNDSISLTNCDALLFLK